MLNEYSKIYELNFFLLISMHFHDIQLIYCFSVVSANNLRGVVMQLYIMRHGEAQESASNDEQRALNERGCEEVINVAGLLNQECFDLVLVSPYVRAQQTAQLIIKNNKLTAKIETVDLITPFGSAEKIHRFLYALLLEHNYQKVLLVSHMPLISLLLAELTVDKQMPIFQTAAVAKVEYSITDMQGHFVEMLCPFDLCDI